MSIIEVKQLKKIYNRYSPYPKTALKDLNLDVEQNEFICIMGSSGSGKTTLINVLSTIDDATYGTILIDGENVALMTEKERAYLRKSQIGFIFQNYNLIESLTIKDNILFSLRLNHISQDIQNERLNQIIKQLDIEEIIHKYPSQCSGGQQQRVAIARAIIMQPKIIFADEPTGNLDSYNAKELMTLFVKMNQKTTIIMVTHDSLVASYSSKMYYMKDGKLDTCIQRDNKSQEQFYREIVEITSQMNLQSV